MKVIKSVDDRPSHFEEQLPADVMAQIPTFRRMFKSVCGMGLAKSGDEAVDLVQIGLKFSLAESDITLEDAEFKLLESRCAANPCGWQAHFHGQVMIKLREAEKKG